MGITNNNSTRLHIATLGVKFTEGSTAETLAVSAPALGSTSEGQQFRRDFEFHFNADLSTNVTLTIAGVSITSFAVSLGVGYSIEGRVTGSPVHGIVRYKITRLDTGVVANDSAFVYGTTLYNAMAAGEHNYTIAGTPLDDSDGDAFGFVSF